MRGAGFWFPSSSSKREVSVVDCFNGMASSSHGINFDLGLLDGQQGDDSRG